MVSLALAMDEVKKQLTESVRGAIKEGFELVAGVVGGKLAQNMEAIMKNAAGVGKGASSAVELVGLREQIRDNAIILLPLQATHHGIPVCGSRLDNADFGARIRVVTFGHADTGGVRAGLFETLGGGKPYMHYHTGKHETASAALKSLLRQTETHLRFLVGTFYATPAPSPDMADGQHEWARKPSPVDSGTTICDDKLFWDADMITNPSFQKAGGFDYGSFDSGLGSDGSGATYVQPATKTRWA